MASIAVATDFMAVCMSNAHCGGASSTKMNSIILV
jgi:hypothetical protein